MNELLQKRRRESLLRINSKQVENLFVMTDAVYSHRPGLCHHMLSIHKVARYSCDQCEYKTIDQGNLTKQRKSKHYGVGYICDQCEYIAIRQSSLATC